MTEQEKRLSEYELQIATSEVRATNAVITDEQFQKLARAIGSEVEVQVKERHIIDEMCGRPRLIQWTFVLRDFNFVGIPGRRFLAFLKGVDGDDRIFNIFPYKTRKDSRSYSWPTYHDSSLEKVVRLSETIWSFERHGEPVLVEGRQDFHQIGILGAIEAASTSYFDSTLHRE